MVEIGAITPIPLSLPVYSHAPAPSHHAYCVNAPACPQLLSDNSYPSGTFCSLKHPPFPNFDPLPLDPFIDSNVLSSTVDTDTFAIPLQDLCRSVDGGQHLNPTALLSSSSGTSCEFADPFSFPLTASNDSTEAISLDFVPGSESEFGASTDSTQSLPAQAAIDLVVADSEIHFVANTDKKAAHRIRNKVTAQRHRQNKVRRIRELEKLLDECEVSKERWKQRALGLGWKESANE
ncbi:hypothetical protein V1508DRAFT_406645 [Lipomyces doorenjongii]|uniref:uncharacterized protein n=1 Tax=Lipomyces doorenjongii TaxID=383834 RepID=UPI0034CD4E5F